MRLLLVRHGATANNAERRFTGQSDAPLSPLGQRQAEALAGVLADEPFDLILSSDLMRARQTAAIIAAHNPTPLRFDPDLREVALGEWEGRVYADVAATDGERLTRWEADPKAPAPPGGESIAQLGARAAGAIARCQAEYPTGRVLCVTHGAFIGALLCHLLGIPLAHRTQFRYDNAGITELDLAAAHGMLSRLNDTGHLRGLPAAETSQVM
jgi:broad specificity phosphatase PhoE